MGKNKFFHSVWFGMGVTQLALILGGGASASAAPELDRSVYPVRVSRSFFEHPMRGNVVLRALDGEQPASYASEVRWQEQPTQLPPPAEPYLADFRDFPACAEFSDLEGVQLCFTVAPDVSSVDLSEKKMSLEGLNSAAISSCNDGTLQNVRFNEAKRTAENSFAVYYLAECTGSDGAARPVSIELQVERG